MSNNNAQPKRLSRKAQLLASAGIILFALLASFYFGNQEPPTSLQSTAGQERAMTGTYYADIAIQDYGTVTVELNGDAAPITVGNFVMAYNVVLYVAAGLICHSWILPLYSIITYYVGQNAVDFIVEGLDRSKSVMIITEKGDAVSQALIDAFACGTTKLPARGGFTNVDKTVIYFVVNRFQIARMRTIVHDIDPAAFLTISDVADVFRSVHAHQKHEEPVEELTAEEIIE